MSAPPRRPVAGGVLAGEPGVSLRTLYRSIAPSRRRGAHRRRSRHRLRAVSGPLSPLVFSREEVEAIALRARWVADRKDTGLEKAAVREHAKISAVLTPGLRRKLESSPPLVGPGALLAVREEHLAMVREAIRSGCKVGIAYRDEKGVVPERIIWPFALGFFERVQLIVAWCELRRDFPHFRADRLQTVRVPDIPYPRSRESLPLEWRQREGIPGGAFSADKN